MAKRVTARIKSRIKFYIKAIPHRLMRNYRDGQVGDWLRVNGVGLITVPSEMDPRASLAVAIHELIEMLLCERDGVREEDVSAFDHDNPQLEEPGEDPRAPYHRQHQAAEHVERAVCNAMGLTWEEYSRIVDGMFQNKRGKHGKSS